MASFFAKIVGQSVSPRFRLVVAKEAVEDDEVVDLGNAADERVVLAEEAFELGAGPVDGELRWMKGQILQHEFEEAAAAALALVRFHDEEVEHARRTRF